MGVNLKRKKRSSSLTSHDPPAMVVVMVMVALVLLINTNCCGASFLLKSNVSSYRQCISSGTMDGCLIADDLELEFEFLMDTHVVRILGAQGGSNSITGGTGDRTNYKICYTEEGKPYDCDAPPNGNSGGDNGNTYNRGPGKQP